MYIVGHSLSVVDSGAAKSSELTGHAIVATMACDIVDNHGWAYPRTFSWPQASSNKRFMQVHIIGDWFVHFGDGREQKRDGWAYQVMRPVVAKYEEFFSEAYRCGFRGSDEPNDTARGFAHTIAEYVIDMHLARAGKFDAYFEDGKAAIGRLFEVDGNAAGSRLWLRKMLEMETMPYEPSRIERQVTSFAGRARMTNKPEDFVVFALIDKFLLSYSTASQQYVRRFMDEALLAISARHIERHYAECCEFIHAKM